jgi:hypothetical protein
MSDTCQKMKQSPPTMLVGDTLKAKVFRGGAWLGAGKQSATHWDDKNHFSFPLLP